MESINSSKKNILYINMLSKEIVILLINYQIDQ